MSFEIKRGVALHNEKPPRSKYPWAEMQVGDMFEVPGATAAAVRTAASWYAARSKTKFKIATRKLGSGNIGVWRVE